MFTYNMESIWFLAFVGLMSYEIYQFYKLARISQNHETKEEIPMPRVPYADFDYTNEADIEQGNFLEVQRDGAAYIYRMNDGVTMYKSYFPYSKKVEPNYNVPQVHATYA